MNIDKMIYLTEGLQTKADKMRVLDRAGYARADIARFLGVRYQQVRNTLEGDKRTGYHPEISVSHDATPADGAETPSVFRPVEIDENGFANIPPDILSGFADQDEQLFALKLSDGVFLSTAKGMARRAQSSLE